MVVIKKSQKITNNVVAFLEQGGVVICPTDTVYGLVCQAADQEAVKRLYGLK